MGRESPDSIAKKGGHSSLQKGHTNKEEDSVATTESKSTCERMGIRSEGLRSVGSDRSDSDR